MLDYVINNNMNSDNDEKVGNVTEATTTATTKKNVTNSDLFGDDSDDDDDDAMKVDKPSTTNAESKGSLKKSKPANSELFGEDSDDDDEGEAKLDDVVGSAAPPSSKPPKAEVSHLDDDYDDDGHGASTSEMIDSTVVKPPEKATVLESTRPSDNVTMHMTKLPNLVAVQPSAFDEVFYDEKEEEEQYKGYVHNMIRWRYKRNADGEIQRDDDGNLLRESNSRLVQWSDGSFTLHIGNEAFDVHNQVSSTSKSGMGVNGFVYLSQKATFSNEGQDDTQGGTVLECIAPITSRFVPKPSSLQSEAHKSLTVAVRQRTIKKARIAEHVTYEDPEKAKEARIRNKEDLEKATSRRASSGYRASTGTSRYRRPAMNRSYLEEDEDDGDYDTTKINALKKGNAMDDDMDDYGDESEDDGYEATYRKGRDRKRRKQEREEEEEEEELVFGAESDEEEGTLIKASKKPKRSHQAVVDDDED